MDVRSVSENKKGFQRKGFYDCLCILQIGFLEIYIQNPSTNQVRTFLRIPLIALRLFLVLSRFKNSSNGFLGILTHQY